ncbi:MAG TPA: sigma 54-interacting transcriptional regulator [Polyangiaceae bacterium]|nr:sigma 54-interacting transcriptional regulator [Polyangiaceae bacterium]
MSDDDRTATFTEDAEAPADAKERRFVVRWVFPESAQPPATFLSDEPRVVGRDASCDTVLVSSEVSRAHAEFRKNGPLLLVRDLDSKNGLQVNGERVESAVLSVGSVLRICEWIGVVSEVQEGTDLAVRALGSGMWGGPELSAVVERARKAAKSQLPLAIVGETGSGKERLAAAVHAMSERSGPYLAVNCANYGSELAAAELFGHGQGAFTGAGRARVGHIEASQGGTLFLDEVAELPPAVQPQLLRVLEQRELIRLGESRPVLVDVRFVCASQVPLARLVEQGKFRADLRARLEGVMLELPPLRQRRADISSLLSQMLASAARQHSSPGRSPASVPRLDPRLVERLCMHDWPLNVRELGLVAQRMITLHGDQPSLGLTELADVMPDLTPPAASPVESPQPRDLRAPKHEKISALLAALDRHDGILSRAAEELGITRQKAYRLLEASKIKSH